ncbi:TPA: type II toxin-antitoxin system VapC family toxin [Salmonella enterica]|nr:type II toxin-antitoxin system VapC family toxin [Salmonella enterica]ECI3888009.1 type II toxin-antitoxin system VapC family toxin [Salmonella enterica subsp. enterica serovar Gombe]ECK2143412.1 type II toxin-antitoxin system VapC family toxin [Salmonella enterica subsp. enterica serovar Enteritidis]HDC2546811.1 type II toxin-antitoxin system VapC family toxin [Salmonella enterica]HDC2561790.1 type II toxin-antitoxin system VapC family toxin [Salmonella enterica]
MYILDTNVVSELRKARTGRIDTNVATWAESMEASDLFISSITIMELELGILSVERRDAMQGSLLRSWFEQHVLPEFSGRTLPVDTAVALRCARLHVPDKRGERDALIAATALVHGMTIVTRNVVDFEPTGVSIINPWVS